MYDPRVGRFLSPDPLGKKYPYFSVYQFASNSTIANTDLDGREAKVSFNFATVSKDRTQIQVNVAIDINVQVINLSSTANSDIDLQNVALNLRLDLEDKLKGAHSSLVGLPFIFKSEGNTVTGVSLTPDGKNKDYMVTLNAQVYPTVTVTSDISKINKDAWVFAVVDQVNTGPKREAEAGLADEAGGGKAAIGEAKYFQTDFAYNEGSQLILHEVLHLLGTTDTYTKGWHFPGTGSSDNVMYSLSPDNKRQLTADQIVQEILPATIGGIYNLFTPGIYKQPENKNSNTPIVAGNIS